jgi:hypothetical protein
MQKHKNMPHSNDNNEIGFHTARNNYSRAQRPRYKILYPDVYENQEIYLMYVYAHIQLSNVILLEHTKPSLTVHYYGVSTGPTGSGCAPIYY